MMAAPLASGDGSLRIKRSRVTLRQQVLDVLRNAILDNRFKPGDRLIERELCELTGVSRTSVREALRHLESEGLVHNIPNRGPTVATLTLEEAQHVYEIREVLEGLAGRLFAQRATDRQVNDLRKASEGLQKAFKTKDIRRIIGETTNFYDVFLAGSGNKLIGDTIRSLHARIVFLRKTSMSQHGRWPGSLAEMQRIVDALCKRDSDAAEEACKDHVRRACAAALTMLRQRQVEAESVSN
jgi:DNA-binding GntR family transcriptional regulator